jgi:phage baseplate assembly protein gpV
VGWVLAYGSLVSPDDPLVRRIASAGRGIPGEVEGMRRTWVAGMENRAGENDAKHYVDPDGGRPDVVVVTLSADEDPGGTLPVVALPVDTDGLARTDAREARYDRIEVGARFSGALPGPVWIYRATGRARERTAAAAVAGRAVVSAAYVARVERAFRARGEAAWRAYRASTDEPPFPRRDLRLRYGAGPDAPGCGDRRG